jgi:peptidoglycan/LPS O-acetylase OafA/YrhL
VVVVVDHAGAGWLSGGFVGVDVFFVISGYLITKLLVREATVSGRISIGDFYARRARRILPAATLVIVVTMAYAAERLALSRVQQLGEDAVWSAFFAANVHFARLGTDYFAEGRQPSAFQHFWSLAVEEQFYLVWPLLLAGVLVVVARTGGSSEVRLRALTVTLVLVVLASAAWSLVQTQTSPGTAFYSSPARAWELAVGSLIAVQ